MSYEESLKAITLTADASIGIYTGVPGQPGSPQPHGGKQYHFVKVTGVGQAGVAGAGESAIGVLQNKPQGTGHAATVAISGVSNVVASAAITAGALVESTAAGQAVTKSTGVALGTALGTATGAGQLIPVLLG